VTSTKAVGPQELASCRKRPATAHVERLEAMGPDELPFAGALTPCPDDGKVGDTGECEVF
jgi:hypothetical protein